MSGLKLRGVRKSFGAIEVIKGVDLDIEDEEFVVFVGPSGCGKSTLLRMIAGLETITAGDIDIGNQRVNDLELEELLVTDTVPVPDVAPDALRVVSCAPLLADTIHRIFTDDSVAEAFGGENI